ncbi:MAG: LamG domain-containing protein [Candidatus Omnitrophica bacterium]|nr:LamG domain-containing protein [Candidatus Omnitrophota bacterium]
MKKKLFLILILPVLILVGAWFLRGVFATSNPNSWTNGLVGYWSFDGQYTTSTYGTKDVSNNGGYGIFSGGVKPIGGISGQALSFDGVDDYVNNSTADWRSEDSVGSIEVWFKTSKSATNQTLFASADEAGSERYFRFRVRSIGNVLNISNNIDSEDSVSGSTVVNDNNWHQAVLVSDGSAYSIFLDGVAENLTIISGTNSGDWFSDTTLRDNFTIGAMKYNSTIIHYFNGLIDEVRIYNRALSADEIKQHYEQTRRNLDVNQPSGAPPVGWWKMDEPTGITVKDWSGNNNNGTVSNGGYGATSTDGKIGKALFFDGTDDYVSIPDSIVDLSGDFTVGLWVAISGVPDTGTNSRVFSLVDGADNLEMVIYPGGNVGYRLNGTSWASSGQVLIPQDNIWHYYVLKSENGVGTIYVDNKEISLPSSGITSDASFSAIGSGYQTTTYNTKGKIDDVRIYNYARTAEQITADYQAGAYRTVINSSNPNSWTNGLVGYWSFDGKYTTSTYGTKDVSGNNNWGAFSGGVRPISGISGQALSFDGVDDYMNCGHNTNLNITGDFTVELWLKTSFTGSYMSIDKGQYGTGGFLLYFERISATSLDLIMDTIQSGGYQRTQSLGFTHGNSWHQYVFLLNGSTGRLYVDGVELSYQTQPVCSPPDSATTRDFILGSTYKIDGSVDEVRFYNRALSAEEIKQHYQQTRRNVGI